ncbi:MAG: triose-phosphate isomerase [Alphaproteobacteria bacterium]|nr:triose-phosphate isomerase [Alphaproteobacteria bacterium]
MSTNTKKLLVAGNWKMNNSLDEAVSLIQNINSTIDSNPDVLQKADFLICPSYVHLAPVAQIVDGGSVTLGAQDCSFDDNGAHTGDVSVQMLKDLGCEMVIVGHSERRHNCGEGSDVVAQKAMKAHKDGLIAIICVGETLEQRESGNAFSVVLEQLEVSIPKSATVENMVIAYEPVWAIGTGKVASSEDVKVMHETIAHYLKEKLDMGGAIRILYGGSVKPENANDLSCIEHVDGFLIGGASLKADSFVGIAQNI